VTIEKKWEDHPRLKTAGEKRPPEALKVTPEMLKRREFRRNKPWTIPPNRYYFNTQATKDGVRHFVEGMGDNNPLFSNEDYAKKTKYGRIIAPGSYLYTIMWSSLSGGLPGLHEWYSGGDWEWYKPIFLGDEFKIVNVVRDLVIKKGRSTGGNIYIDYGDVIYINQNDEIVGKELYHGVWVEREASGTAGKYLSTPKPVYGKEDWIRILEAYDKEELRGSEPRYWEDVQIGDKIVAYLKNKRIGALGNIIGNYSIDEVTLHGDYWKTRKIQWNHKSYYGWDFSDELSGEVKTMLSQRNTVQELEKGQYEEIEKLILSF